MLSLEWSNKEFTNNRSSVVSINVNKIVFVQIILNLTSWKSDS